MAECGCGLPGTALHLAMCTVQSFVPIWYCAPCRCVYCTEYCAHLVLRSMLLCVLYRVLCPSGTALHLAVCTVQSTVPTWYCAPSHCVLHRVLCPPGTVLYLTCVLHRVLCSPEESTPPHCWYVLSKIQHSGVCSRASGPLHNSTSVGVGPDLYLFVALLQYTAIKSSGSLYAIFYRPWKFLAFKSIEYIGLNHLVIQLCRMDSFVAMCTKYDSLCVFHLIL